MKKLIFAVSLISALLTAAEPSKLVIEQLTYPQTLKPGEPFTLKLKCNASEKLPFDAWKMYVYKPYAPEGIEPHPGTTVDLPNDPKWAAYQLTPVHWIARDRRNQKEYELKADSTRWPAGNYQARLQLISGNQSTVTALTFSIEEPAVPVRIDGKNDDAIYAGKEWWSGFKPFGIEKTPLPETRFQIAHDRDYLYFYIEAREPNMDKLVLNPNREVSAALWKNDNLEINLVPDGIGNYFYKIIVDADGRIADFLLVDDNTGNRTYAEYPAWRSFAEAAVVKSADGYSLEIRVPFASMEYPEKSPENWRYNVNRTRYAGGKQQLSSFVALSGLNYNSPWEFALLPLPGFERQRFDWRLLNASGATRMAGKQLTYDFLIDAANYTGSSGVFGAVASLGKDGKLITQQKREKLSVGTGNFTQLKFELPVPQPGDYQLDVTLSDLTGKLLKNYNSAVTVEYTPVKITLLNPPYRNNIYETMPDKTITARISAPGFPAGKLEVSLTGPETNLTQSVNLPAGQSADINFDAAALPYGEYLLKAVFANFEGKTIIRKLPYQAGEVFLDKYGITHVDGKRVLPFGWFRNGSRLASPEENTMQSYAEFQTADRFNEFVRQMGETRQRHILIPPYPRKDNLFALLKRKGELTAEQQAALREYLPQISKQPWLLGWYMSDEPELRDNPNWYFKLYDLMSELDPYHPTIMLNWGIPGMKEFYRSCDILMPDCYPTFFESGTAKPRWSTSQWTAEGVKMRPTWIVIQAFAWYAVHPTDGSRGLAPDFDDLRNQIYQVFANDGKGILMYCFEHYSQMFAGLRLGPDFLGTELLHAKDFLLDPNVPDGIKVKTTPPDKYFQAALKMLDGRICVIAVNTSTRNLRAEMTINAKVDELHVLSENRTVKVENGVIRDEFKPLEAKVYLNSAEVASQTSLSAIRNEIAEFQKNRFKPGNLVATGELYLADYLNTAKGQALPNQPVITASSQATDYFSRQLGTLYFLLDGIVEEDPRYYGMAWGPAENDRAPWIKIKLKQPETISRVVLHATRINNTIRLCDGKLLAGRNGQFQTVAEFKDNSATRIELNFNPVEADEIQLVFDKLRPNSRLQVLSEIEVYK